MRRPPALLLWLAIFASGLSLGLTIGRREIPLQAQARSGSDLPPANRGGDDAVYRDLAQSYERFKAVDRVFESVARAVSPAVVHITAKKTGQKEDQDDGPYEETGSGVIVHADGGKGLFVLTNHHVIEGADPGGLTILLHDGQTLHPLKVWSDSKADVAVLKLGRDDLPSARLGDSDQARVGSWVLALGSPFGLTHSVSQGIISAKGRYEEELEMDGVEHQEFLQTDAAINPGNSGGPLVNLKGEVVGLNTAIASEGGGSEGVGFSIPINLARWAMTQLVTSGKVSRGALGVNLQDVSPEKAVELGLGHPQGARVTGVHEGSPAERAGILSGDVVLQFNGVEVIDNNHLSNLVSIAPIGKPADVVLWRGKSRIPIQASVGDREAILARALPSPPSRLTPNTKPADDLGLSLAALDEPTSRRLFGGKDPASGVLVVKVAPTSPYAGVLKAQDVLQTVGKSAVRTPNDALKAFLDRPPHTALDITFHRVESGTVRLRTVHVP